MSRFDQLLEQLPLARDRRWIGYGVAALLTVVATVLRQQMAPLLPSGYPFLTYFPAVLLATFFFGRGPGVVTAVASAIASWYLFIPPTHVFNVDRSVLVAMLLYGFVVTTEILLVTLAQNTQRRLAAERRTSAALAERSELLFEELQHRVGNNLQMIAALLNLHRQKIVDPAARSELQSAVRRVAAIGAVSRDLYAADGQRETLGKLLQSVADHVRDAAGRHAVTITISADAALTVAPGQAMPVAIIFAELLSNAFEHGLAGDHGTVSVHLRRTGDIVRLDVENDGRDLVTHIDPAHATSIGLRVVHGLAQQLEGRLTLSARAGGGAIARLEFPA